MEGFRHENYPKIEINRHLDTELLAESDESIIAIVSDREDISHLSIPQLKLANSLGLANFITMYAEDARRTLKG